MMMLSGESAAAVALDEDRLAWLALMLTPGLGPRRILVAMRQLEAPSQVFGLSLTAIEGLKFPAGAAQHVFEGKARAAAEKELELASEHGVEIVSFGCGEYPERLKEIYDPPPVLWVRGNAGLLARPSIAIVGTRHPSPYGTGIAEMLGRDLSARGMLIVSGMARGIDTYAHKGALAAGRPTVAVWGTGADVIYPKENKKLAEDILATGGAIVSELPLGTFPAPQNFPRRNRILSGVSVGVLVVEDVWETLPSQIRLELEAGWAVESKSGSGASEVTDGLAGAGLADAPEGLRGREAVVFGALRQDAALQLDELLELVETQLSSAEVFTALFELELAGRIRSLPGKNYVRRM